MNNGIATFKKRWLALAAVVVLLAAALTAGTLFAANERPQPELSAASQQSVRDVTDPGLATDLPVAPPAPERVFAQPDDNDREEIDLPPIVKQPPKYPNLDSNLNRLVEQVETQPAGQQPNTTDSTGGGSAPAGEPVLVTFYVEPERIADLRRYLEASGIFVRNVGEDYIEAHVPPSQLAEASEQPGVLRVDTIIPPRPAQSRGNVISQGVGIHGADAWHNAGYRGQNVKVGVIDSGFEGFSRLQARGELPGNVTARCYFDGPRAPSSRLADCEVDSEHGTAVAETLVDVAPEAELYIANPRTWGDLRNAVDWMAGAGVNVINMSLGWGNDGPGDGTSPFSDSPLRTIDAAVSRGIAWINAGGNEAQRVWHGRFSDTDNDGWHNYTPRDEGNSFIVEEGDRVTAFMRWDDSWERADCDLDLYLYRSFPGSGDLQLVDEDIAWQDGSAGSFPLAIVRLSDEATAAQAGRYSLYIRMERGACANHPAWIQLTAWIGEDLQYYSDGHHIGNPAESRNPGMMAVGATRHWDTYVIDDYSSRGPTIDGRTKPDITGITCNTTATIPPVIKAGGTFYRTCGTSFSAPHIAGLAALVKQRFPGYTPAQTVSYLQQNASDRGPAGADNTWGHGLAALPAPSAAPTPRPTPAPVQITPTANIAVRDGISPGEIVISWDAVPGAAHYRIGYVNMATDYPLAKASATGDWINAFIYVDEDARNLPVSNGRVESTLRRLAPGVRHAFTVLTSNDVVNTRETIGGTYYWPQNPRWTFHNVGN